MLKNSKLLTITVPKATYTAIRQAARKRQETISGMLRNAFEAYTSTNGSIYSDQELNALLKRDKLPAKLKHELDRLLAD